MRRSRHSGRLRVRHSLPSSVVSAAGILPIISASLTALPAHGAAAFVARNQLPALDVVSGHAGRGQDLATIWARQVGLCHPKLP
jgi:hypothetical protein